MRITHLESILTLMVIQMIMIVLKIFAGTDVKLVIDICIIVLNVTVLYIIYRVPKEVRVSFDYVFVAICTMQVIVTTMGLFYE